MSAVMAPWPDSEHHVDEHNIGIPDAVFVKLMIAMVTSGFFFIFLGSFLNHYRSFSSGPNASILKSLPPVFVYSKTKTETETKVVEDCAVCLSEFEESDKCLVLPNCKHCFHSACIHMWFSNHSTCPLCRSPVVIVDQVTTPHPATASSIQTTTSSSEPAVVDVRIDIVPVVNETEPESQITSQVQEEEEEEEISINMSQSLV
ncbi:putative transcription factor C2H2 family [Helianthus annuus]|nr:putative transcription factor C2H2 family [Helianthus annuus]KAJ0647211.1 putative transcription factor C2H2 family [Helianthus annuus]KAJ0842962.1 putative transcription factor C2H2 family [Helianthus annuus]